MTTKDKQEAERIAGELAKAHAHLIFDGKAGLNARKLETMLLAKAVQIFDGTLEVPQQRDEL